MEALQTIEFAFLDWIQAALRCDLLDVFFPAFTTLCNHGEIWIALAVLLLSVKKYRKTGASVAAALLINLLITNVALKPLIGRVRPCAINAAVELLVKIPVDASFPSGHTACSFAAVGALKASDSRLWKPAAVLAVLMAFSRLYLYVHWPTDIVGGVLIGLLAGWLGSKAVQFAAENIRFHGK